VCVWYVLCMVCVVCLVCVCVVCVFAFDLGLDMELFESCLDSGKYKKRVQSNTNESAKNGVAGTPTFFIIGPDNQQKTINGPQPYSVFKDVIESMM